MDRSYAGIVYWRRSLWNGMRCVPVLLTLDEGRLRACDRRGAEVFAALAGQVEARGTIVGTMLLTAGGDRYALVGVGATVSPSPSAEQRRRLEEYTARTEPVPDLASWWEVLARAGVTVR
ncbi:hypothetical protein O7622_18390 [Micromonospora sp. WMMD1076]|uniref:hypothetical protein n=1 Tax=Micromonospora sp. WMMD1076 TaxID=3016103 RepID=UPI002499F5BD|nr:hypothetical protein [Micromonospora sp. WMMD1076]WFF05031.1 hypothetical protein O7622_18390 [Micromonospora sp. WMMD1076]